jgi:hypothetical protein
LLVLPGDGLGDVDADGAVLGPELKKYAAALNDPRNTEMRGVETITNNQESVQYWRIMMAAYGVKGNARYVP